MSSIIVANSNPDYAKKIAAVLRSSGLYIGGVCSTGAQVIDFANKHYHGGVVVSSMKLRDMPAFQLPRVVGSGYDLLYLVGSEFAGMSESLESVSLMLPINRMSLISTVNMLLNITDYTPLSIKKKLTGGNFDEKELIAKAKDLLIERNNLTEAQAHRFIQKKSMDNGKKMVETSMIILNS
jgi:two-component system, response regulator PdtaR